jgi:glycosyltransferase involved in cell wall biosynthesis
MKLIHLFSNWRWTGPAEPVTNLVAALHRSDWDITFSFGKERRTVKNGLLHHAEQRGIPIRPGLLLQKHTNLLYDYFDSRRLRSWLRNDHFNIVHAHLRNAHVITAMAIRPIEEKPLIIRTCYESDGPFGFREAVLLRRYTDGLIVVSDRTRQAVINKVGFRSDRIWSVHTPIDMDRFNPDRGLGDRRDEFGIDPSAFVVGIIARVQWHRRYHVFLEAIERARHRLPNLRAIIVGRGTNMKPIAIDPIKRMGLSHIIMLPGYQTGDDFVRTISSMDVNVYLVPGTDGSCRAVREAMAMGVPTIASKRGMLPELVGNDERGLVIEDTPQNLASAIIALANNRKRCMSFGQHAKRFAMEHFPLDRQADIVGGIYRELMERGKQ